MATTREYVCGKCKHRSFTPDLFDTLLKFSERPSCCEEAMDLHLGFRFGLGAGHPTCKVLDVFIPPDEDLDRWKDDSGNPVTFYPFLVVLGDPEGAKGTSFWLPYWHVVDGPRRSKKYGQWAPNMGGYLFKSLVGQAHAKGYL